MPQGLGHIKLQDKKILVLAMQGRTTWSYKKRESGPEGFEIMDNDFLSSKDGEEYLEKIINGESVTL